MIQEVSCTLNYGGYSTGITYDDFYMFIALATELPC
jgi:hypothetical protein